MHYKTLIRSFIKDQLEKLTKSLCTSYGNGYKQALIDIECLIMDIENREELLGKFGYFWDKEKSPVIYDKLISINTNDEFGSNISYSCNGMLPFENFSLTPPKHLK